MPVSDPFGPSVYVPDLGANNASAGWAAGISNLAKGLFPDPSAVAEARLRGAQTQQLTNATQAQSQLQQILAGDPNQASDPAVRAKYLSTIMMLPAEQQNAARSSIGAWLANSNLPKDQQDAFVGTAGIAPFQNTPTGVNQNIQKDINVAHIGANAQTTSAAIGANAQVQSATIGAAGRLQEENTRQQGENYRQTQNIVPVLTPDGPRNTTQGEVNNGGYVPMSVFQSPNDAAAYSFYAQNNGIPLKSPPGAAPSHGTSPGGETTQPQTGTTTAPAANGNGNPSDSWYASLTRNTTNANITKENVADALQRIVDNDLNMRTTAGTPYVLGPGIASAVMRRTGELMSNPTNKQFFNNLDGAMAQAYSELVTPYVSDPTKITQSNVFWRSERTSPAVADYTRGFVPPWPGSGTPLPATPQPAPAPRPVPAPLAPSNRAAIPQPPPAPPPLKPAPRPRAQQSAPASAPPPPPAPSPAPASAPPAGQSLNLEGVPPSMRGKPGLVYHGQTYTGGNPRAASSWHPSTPAEISNAQQQGIFVQ